MSNWFLGLIHRGIKLRDGEYILSPSMVYEIIKFDYFIRAAYLMFFIKELRSLFADPSTNNVV